MMRRTLWALLGIAALTWSAHAQVWTEQGDAGDLPETAQSTGTGPLSQIQGTLAVNDVDMYAIYIDDPASFSATTVGGATWDTQLFLFDADGKGVVANDDSGGRLQSTINNANGCIPSPGLYYLAITRYNKDPLGCNDGGLWLTNTNNCPNGTESTSRVASWTSSTSAAGAYTIFLTGVSGATAGDPDDCPPPPPFEGWDETANGGGDAGDLPATAQLITASDATPCQTPVQRIRGNLEADGVDMYVICITDPASFSATTVGGASFDTQLWLFNCDGTGVAFNDDTSSAVSQSTIDLSALSGNCQLPPAGTYLLAVSRYNRDAVDASGQLLWNNSPFTGVRCPDGPGASNPVAGWTGTTSAGGTYIIQLQGAYFVSTAGCETPPGCEGDADSDGDVDDADLLAVLFAFGNTCSGCPEDVDGDGDVDDADLLTVLFNFGCGSGS